MSWLSGALGFLLAGAIALQVPTDSRHFVSPEGCLRFEFDYPRNWVVVPSDKETPCRVRLRPNHFAESMKGPLAADFYTLHVGAETAGFLEAAAGNSFDFVRGRWVILGRHLAKTEAEVVSTQRWHGVRGDAVAGCSDARGSYVGICEEPTLVLRDDNENVWSMRGGPQSMDAFELILSSFRFRED